MNLSNVCNIENLVPFQNCTHCRRGNPGLDFGDGSDCIFLEKGGKEEQ